MSSDMPFEMLRSLVQQRVHEGVAPEAIRAELAAMGVRSSDADVLLKTKAPEALVARESLYFWEFLPLAPMCIAPVILMIMAAALDTPSLAIGMFMVGGAVWLLGKISTIVLAFQEHFAFAIGLFIFPGCVDLMLLFIHRKFWMALGCQFFGTLVMVAAVFVDPKGLEQYLNERRFHKAERATTPATAQAWNGLVLPACS